MIRPQYSAWMRRLNPNCTARPISFSRRPVRCLDRIALPNLHSRLLSGTSSALSNTEIDAFPQFLKQSAIKVREQCWCPQCLDQSTRQREYCFADIPLDIQAKSVKRQGSKWIVEWHNDLPGFTNHVSEYSSAQLQVIANQLEHLNRQDVVLWDKQTFENETKTVDFDALMQTDETLAQALSLIMRHGLVFVNHVPQDPTIVKTIANRLGLLRNTFYGETWDVRSVPQAKNVAYTSKFLGFHMDLLYMKEPPGIQLLHTLENSCKGGESLFADTWKAIDILHSHDEKLTAALTSPIRYTYSNDGHYFTDVKPVISLGKPLGGRTLTGNKTQYLEYVNRVYWSPPFIGSISETPASRLKDLVQASKAFATLLELPEHVYQTKMEVGTCAVFDNLRVVHARNSFDINSGRRWLKGAYADIQDVFSKHHRINR